MFYLPPDSPLFFILLSVPLSRTDQVDYINGLPHPSGFLLCLASGKTRRRTERGWRVRVFIHSTLSLEGHLGLAESLGLRSQCLSESFSIQSSISPPSSDFSLLLTLQDLGVITESCCTLSFMVYLYPAYTSVTSSLRKHFSKYPIWVLHLPRPWLSEIASHHNSPYSSSLPYFSP